MIDKLSRGQKIVSYSMLFLLALAILFPIYFMLSVSLKTPKDIYRTPSLLPTGALSRTSPLAWKGCRKARTAGSCGISSV